MSRTLPNQSPNQFDDAGRSRALALTPLFILAVSAVVLSVKWDDIPERWAVHWGAHDTPDRWASKTVLAVFMPVLLGAFLWLFLEGISAFVSSYARRGKNRALPIESAIAVADLTVQLMRLIEIGLVAMIAVIAVVLPLVRPASSLPIVGFTFMVIILSIAIGLTRLKKGVRELKQAGYRGLDHYNGITYKNPNDPRLWVQKISGVGYTLNFAHPWAWPVLLLMVGVPVLVVIAVLILASQTS